MSLYEQALEITHEFHDVFGDPIAAAPTLGLLQTRHNLVLEEAKELKEAIESGDEEGVIDALGDLVYVAAGSITAMKSSWLSLESHVDANAGYILAKSVRNTFRTDLEMVVAIALSSCETLMNGVKVISDVQNLADRFLIGCGVLIKVIEAVMTCGKIDHKSVMEDIHASNMSKLWPADAEMRLELAGSDAERYGDIAFRPCLNRDEYVGYRLSDNKILKCPTYNEVKLGGYVSGVLREALSA